MNSVSSKVRGNTISKVKLMVISGSHPTVLKNSRVSQSLGSQETPGRVISFITFRTCVKFETISNGSVIQ